MSKKQEIIVFIYKGLFANARPRPKGERTMIKVLLADDEPLVRAGIKTVLPWNMYGFDVISEAADGKEAYEKILKLKPDILITDIKMPGMDGITLLKRLKQEKISIQSLVLSCFDEFELVREAMKYGAHDYIRKLSIDPAKLLEVLKEMKEAISDQPEKNASFSLNTDDLAAEEKIFLCVGYKKVSFFIKGKQFLS